MLNLTKNRLSLIRDEIESIKAWESCKCVDISNFNLKFSVYEKDLECLDSSILKRCCVLDLFEDDRFQRLSSFLELCRSGSACCSIEETLENQFYRESLIFDLDSVCSVFSSDSLDSDDQSSDIFKTRVMLSRGLLDIFLDTSRSINFPSNSFSFQLQKDVSALLFFRTMEKMKIGLRIPSILPYNSVSDLIYLYQLQILQDETTWSPYVESEFMRLLFSYGFITISFKANLMGFEKVLLLPKMHDLRCCMKPSDIIVTKKVKRISKKLRITLNTCFHKVVDGIVAKHGEDWMYPEMQLEFMKMHYLNGMYKNIGSNLTENPLYNGSHQYTVDYSDMDTEMDHSDKSIDLNHDLGSTITDGRRNERFVQRNEKTVVSVEVWQGDKLVAGEIGFVNGSVYTSITGFHTLNNSGNFQLVALAAILYFNGFKLWDLGMEIPYKLDLGAKCILRKDFINQLNQYKNQSVNFEVPAKYAGDHNGAQLIGDFIKMITPEETGDGTQQQTMDAS